jgi:hypothetical protein
MLHPYLYFSEVSVKCLALAIGGVIFQNALYLKLESYPSLAADAKNITKNTVAMVEIIR